MLFLQEEWIHSHSAVVDAYNVNLTHSAPTTLSLVRTSLGSTKCGESCIICGQESDWIR